ncbi:hypothetical protein BC937DRAFT_86976 [Endogone sp. FLAS-F59071]|nr:hypothetical protein BC937DRAFT_86976 [Endogone sp. FLAS-F59071]|eukprot:RUS23342.1 hypothetical protein BC937DRAFT_86976 [Endogone sp. FLAS-F59071]
MTIVESEKLPPEEPPRKDGFSLGGFMIFCIFLYFFFLSTRKTVDPNQVPHNSHNLSIWACLPPYPDPVKVTVPSIFDYADVKKALKSELTPRLDTKSLGEILLLTPLYGKVDVAAKVLESPNSNKKRHKKGWKRLQLPPETATSATQPLVVFVDDIETRVILKQRTSIPIQLHEPLCFSDMQKGYIAVAKVLLGPAHFTNIDVSDLRAALCESSLDLSWSKTYRMAQGV